MGGLNSAMSTSLNGLALNETAISVLGNNIANAGTVGFKASTVAFQTQLSQTLGLGSAPSAENGGTNPMQLGLGAATAAISKDFTQGGVSSTNRNSDLAIQGVGFFVLDGPSGLVYTRNGQFAKDADNKLVNLQGLRVQGYGVNDSYEVVETPTLVEIEIPLGVGIVAQRTENVEMGGALLATNAADVATYGTRFLSEALTDNAAAAPITTTTLLSDVRTSTGDSPFVVGEKLEFTPKKSGRTMETLAIDETGGLVTATTTMGDLLQLVQEALGIQTSGVPNDGGTGQPPGISVTAAGEIEVVGNSGVYNRIDDLDIGRFTSNSVGINLEFEEMQSADGESAVTDLVVYDSLGEAIDLRVTVTLESRIPATARYYVESSADSGRSVALNGGTGTIQFDGDGDVLASDAMQSFTLSRDDTNAFSPMSVALDFSGLKSLSSENGSLLTSDQDGFRPGSLVSFAIDQKGIVNGEFSNGESRPLGQIMLASFSNAQGLLENGADTYVDSVSSGAARYAPPGEFGHGTILAGAIELSNTDVGRSLVDLIVASTNYRGNARVISSVQELVDELLLLGR